MKFSLFFITFALLVAGASASENNLIQNGSFENPVLTLYDSTDPPTLDRPQTTPNQWYAVAEPVYTANYCATDGLQSLGLTIYDHPATPNARGSVAQDFVTEVGGVYSVSFDYTAAGNPIPAGLRVELVSGTTTLISEEIGNLVFAGDVRAPVYETFSVEFVATPNTSYTLRFTDTSSSTFQSDVHIDNVEVYLDGNVIVSLDDEAQALGATVDIRYGDSGLGHGSTFMFEDSYQYRVIIGGFSGGWRQGPEGNLLEINVDDEYAIMTLALEAGVPMGTTVDIRYGVQDLLAAESFAVPMGNYQYRIDACGLTGPWKGFTASASADLLVLASEDVAMVAIDADHPDVAVDVRYGQDNDGLKDGEEFCAPSPMSLQYRVVAGGFSGQWIGFTLEGDTALTVSEGTQYAIVSVDEVPDGGNVDVRYGSGNDNLTSGGAFLSPVMQDRQWRLCVGSHCSDWLIYTVADPYVLFVTSGQAYTDVVIDLSTTMGLSLLPMHDADPTARIDIRYGASGLPHGASLELPCTDIQWRLRTEDGSLSGPWRQHSVCAEGNIVPEAGTDVKELQFNFDWTNSKYGKTDVRYVRSFTNCNGTGTHCERMVAPCGADIQARPDLGSITPPWMSESVDCAWDTWTWDVGAEVTTGP